MSVSVVGYVFQADILCPSCLEQALSVRLRAANGYQKRPLAEALDLLAAHEGVDHYDEVTFDSGDFPKVIFSTDEPDQCGPCGEEL
jgi:hypothetical protein